MNYRIKPLVWERFPESDNWAAQSELGLYAVIRVKTLEGDKWKAHCDSDAGWWHRHNTPEAARAACEEDYRKRLLTILEEVEDHSQSIFQDALRLREHMRKAHDELTKHGIPIPN